MPIPSLASPRLPRDRFTVQQNDYSTHVLPLAHGEAERAMSESVHMRIEIYYHKVRHLFLDNVTLFCRKVTWDHQHFFIMLLQSVFWFSKV